MHRAPAAARHCYHRRCLPATAPSRRCRCPPTTAAQPCLQQRPHITIVTHPRTTGAARPPTTGVTAATVASTAGLALSSVKRWSSLCHPAVSHSHCSPPRRHSDRAPPQPTQAPPLASPSPMPGCGEPPPPSSDLCLYEENEFETWYRKWYSPW
jgi:hypothetical protein